MSYMKSDGTFTDSKSEAQLDFIKLNLKISKGTCFNSNYGYDYLNIEDDESIKNTIKNIISSMKDCDFELKEINRNVKGTVIISFTGTDETILF